MKTLTPELRLPLVPRLRLLALWTLPTALVLGAIAYHRNGDSGLKIVGWGLICVVAITILADRVGGFLGRTPLKKYVLATAARLVLGGWAMIFLAFRVAPLPTMEIIGYLSPFYLCLLVTDVHAALRALGPNRR